MIMLTTSLFDFAMKDINGDERPLSAYAGKVVVVVNVASFCGYTYQYEQLEQLYRSRKDKGLVILAFPSNDYGAQEPGTDEEIIEFCKSNFQVSFPMFSKIAVKGEEKHPLYKWLTEGGENDSLHGEVKWNFEKFLIGRDGKVVTRYRREIEPMSEEFLASVDKALAQD